MVAVAAGLEVRVRELARGNAQDLALIDESTGCSYTYEALWHRVEQHAADLQSLPSGPVLLRASNSVGTIEWYLAARAAGTPVVLADAASDDGRLAQLAERFGATASIASSDDGGAVLRRLRDDSTVTHPDLAVLLSTSGSTGSPKLVRLSSQAVRSNAESIVEALSIVAGDVAPTTLPIFYSYGLSVVNSHLAAGATLAVTAASVTTRAFWDFFDHACCSTFAGVPYTYEILRRMRFDARSHPSLHTFTQAGGRLAPPLVEHFADMIEAGGGRLYVMYGQTEATARMAVVPPHRLREKLGSAGTAIPGGRFEPHDGSGEVVYHGPNVMMGYAIEASDLAQGDELGARLETGDTGLLDDEGFLYLTGRTRRIAKVFGTRLSLDDVEDRVRTHHVGAAAAADDGLVVFVESDAAAALALRSELAGWLKVHRSGITVVPVDRLPLLPNGKVDYTSLEENA